MPGQLSGDPDVALSGLEGVDGADIVQTAAGNKGSAVIDRPLKGQSDYFIYSVRQTDTGRYGTL